MLRLVAALAAVLLIASAAGAAARPSERPRIAIARGDTPPRIDGRLDDAAWETAALLGPLTQVEPIEGDAPTHRTEVRLLYDADALYLGIRCFDSDPGAIIAREMVRDRTHVNGDRIAFVLDTFHDLRNGVFFSVNPTGARIDALVDGDRFRREWDGIWHAKARIDALGWTAEVAIPFKTLPFDPDGERWGFNLTRVIRRTNERNRWASPRQNSGVTRIGDAGVLEGLVGLEQGIGLDVKPALSLSQAHDRDRDENDFDPEPSLDVFYRFTPSLAGALTFNTDFGATEVDERQVNLGRFNLFFPEKRDFFLQDAGIFDFGGLEEENGLPFFSRRIGIGAGDEEIPLRAGAKLTGRIGDWNLGLLDVQTAREGGLSGKNLAVARISRNVLQESTIGWIGTIGDPQTNDDNALVGTDFNYRRSDFRGDKTLMGSVWFQRSFTERLSSDQAAYGARLEYPNDIVNYEIEFKEIQAHFSPALGFVNRSDVRVYQGNFRYRLRPESDWVRTVDTGFETRLVTDTDNDMESSEWKTNLITLENDIEDTVSLAYRFRHERVDAPFTIGGEKVPIEIDDYNFGAVQAVAESSPARTFSLRMEISWGEFFGGDRLRLFPTLEWRPSRHFFASLEYDENRIDLPGGKTTIRLVRSRIDLQVTPDLSWNTLAQYDNVSDTFGVQSRIRWIVEPGNELTLVLNQDYDIRHERLRSRTTQGIGRVVWTFRY